MPPDPYFGVEIIETGAGAAVVLDQTAATCFLIGTAPIAEVHATPLLQAPYINKPILIRTREQAAAAFGPHRTGYTIPAALDAIFDQAGPEGIGTIEVVNVYDPAVHIAGPSAVTNLNIIGAFDASGNPTGLKHAYNSYQTFGRFCKIIHAPGFTGLIGVRAEIETIVARIRSRAVIDAPVGSTKQVTLTARGPAGAFDLSFDNRRLAIAWPHMVVVDTVTAGTRFDPYSSRLVSTGPPLELLLTAERARLTALENAGLGVESATLVTDFNAVTKGGSYRALVPANAPTADSGWTLRHEAGQNNTEAVQFATLMATQMSYMRQKSGGVWAPWRETWHAGNAPGNFGLNGYQKLPSGLIVQWGNGTTSASAGVTVTFPIAFPSSHMTINAILAGTSGPICWSVGTLANPKTGFMMHAFTAAGARLATTFTYLVIGY